MKKQSQSPQAGQFNSYLSAKRTSSALSRSQSPQAGQFNSYIISVVSAYGTTEWSQSPQAGQFNSYPFI